ncbi:hypothetical protein [Pseudemcibacter aquimaris]|uniref:hypothetical protein n=1 Tax=Pseudemcibacter aquimaris TaxID=2857064 RepID=UPI0020139306|nr:hypothetical protein [Pseudemcibacter aquimaris]MCC3859605.1 hypothetical protein [Pseudemcibacter aquimaris]WDU60001.1 hypothetical protein KW060_06990 [Pseudemcibacter aquimaris]
MSTYDFMDLLKDKGHVPEIIEQELDIIEEFEQSVNEVIEFFEEATMDYDFIDLLQDKGYAMVSLASNDNEPIYSVAG